MKISKSQAFIYTTLITSEKESDVTNKQLKIVFLTIHSIQCFCDQLIFFPWIEPSFTLSTYTSFPETSQRRVCWRSCHSRFVSVQSAGLLPHCILNHAVDTLLVSQSHYRLRDSTPWLVSTHIKRTWHVTPFSGKLSAARSDVEV